MARIRTIKPQFFLNEELAELPAMVRLQFIGLWTQADREGRLIDRPKRLKAEIFPYDNFDIEKGLKQLSDAGFIVRYKVNANGTARILAPEQPITELAIIQIINFSKHQKIDKINEKDSDLPAPEPIDYEKTINRLPIVEERKGREGNVDMADKPPPRAKFEKPDVGIISNYMAETIDEFTAMGEAQKFFDYYESNGWKVGGKTAMKNWQASVRNWLSNRKDYSKQNGVLKSEPAKRYKF